MNQSANITNELTATPPVISNRLLGTPREKIGLNDREGREICEGDIVEFVVEYDWDYPPKPTYDTPEGTKMRDTVKIIDGKAYFWCDDVQNASFAWRHNKHCRVVGSIHDELPKVESSHREL